jgi:tRNA-specific 2-thiouridylase
MTRKKIAVGLSGGVDSSVAAALLIEQGYEVHGVYLECYNEPGCRTDQDKKDALQVALKLGISFAVLDFRKEYKEKVIEYFYREYEAGRTPNPDVMCNREIKFGIFYDWAIARNFDYVATGHYARIFDGRLQRAHDESKDQSYFLWQVPRDHLSQILFPLGNMLKSEVREKAQALGLSTANKPDSMGICFMGEVNVNKLLKDRLGEKEGEVTMQCHSDLPAQAGTVTQCQIGTHRGLWFHTIGERGGFEIDKSKLKRMGLHPEKMGPLYVIGKDKTKNQLIVGTREETMRDGFQIDLSASLEMTMGKGEGKLWVRIRNLGELYEVSQLHDLPAQAGTVTQQLLVTTLQPLFGVAEGQSAVFYDEEGILVGGGIIV